MSAPLRQHLAYSRILILQTSKTIVCPPILTRWASLAYILDYESDKRGLATRCMEAEDEQPRHIGSEAFVHHSRKRLLTSAVNEHIGSASMLARGNMIFNDISHLLLDPKGMRKRTDILEVDDLVRRSTA